MLAQREVPGLREWVFSGRLSLSAAASAAASLLVLWFYLWTASNGLPFGVGQPHDGFYNLLTQALLRGQLHLPVEPSPGLFELADPYDPGKNAPYRLHDASLYHGKYYIYFGVGPVVTLFVPWHLLGLGDLPESLAAALFAGGGFLFALGLLRHLTRTFLPTTPAWMKTAGVVVVGLANVCPFLLRGAEVYHVAIAAGYFFMLGSAYFLATAAAAPRPWARICAGSLFLGLAVASRPNHLLVAPLVLLLAWPAVRAARDRLPMMAVCALLPFAACAFLIGLYNLARFGSMTDFGVRYQLMGALPLAWFDPRGLLPALYFYFLAPLALRLSFPCIVLDRFYPGTLPLGYFGPDPNASVFMHAPFLLILLAAPWLLRGAPLAEASLFRQRIAVLVAIGVGQPILSSMAHPNASMRYQVDFVSFLLVPAVLLCFLADQRSSGRRRLLLRTLFALAIAWACLVHAALSLTASDDILLQENPALFRSLEAAFEPLRVGLARLLVRDGRRVVHMRVAFPERAAEEREPLVSSGSLEAHDVVWVRAASPGQWRFGLESAGGKEEDALPVAIAPGPFHALEVELDRIRSRVEIRMDGAVIARLRGPLEPVRERTVFVGRGPKGRGALSLGRFSGVILPEGMLWAAPPGLEELPPIAPRPAAFTASVEEKPAAPSSGQLWVPAGREGAYLFTGATWRWIPLYFLDRVRLEGKVVFAGLPAGAVEPLLASGDEGRGAGVFVRHLGGPRVAFGFATWNGRWVLGPEGPPADARPGGQDLIVTLDRPQGFAEVLLDGRTVLRASADLPPIARAHLALGGSPPGMTLGRPAFAGSLLPPGKPAN